MKYLLMIICLVLLSCSSSEKVVYVDKDDPDPIPNPGTTMRFTVTNEHCVPNIDGSDANAQKFCVELGYDHFVNWDGRTEGCGRNFGYPGQLAYVTCWKQ